MKRTSKLRETCVPLLYFLAMKSRLNLVVFFVAMQMKDPKFTSFSGESKED